MGVNASRLAGPGKHFSSGPTLDFNDSLDKVVARENHCFYSSICQPPATHARICSRTGSLIHWLEELVCEGSDGLGSHSVHRSTDDPTDEGSALREDDAGVLRSVLGHELKASLFVNLVSHRHGDFLNQGHSVFISDRDAEIF